MSQSISRSVRRKDAVDKASGRMAYLADRFPVSPLYGRFFYSSVPRGRIISVSLPELSEGYHIFGAQDVPGENLVRMIQDDWPVFASGEVRYIGQILFLVVGPEKEIILRLRDAIRVEYETIPPVLTLAEAEEVKGGPVHGQDNVFTDYLINHAWKEDLFRKAYQVVDSTYRTGYQEHVYLEPQSLFAHWEEDTLIVHASAQCPYYIRHSMTAALGLPKEKIRIIQTPTGGAFGGKEHFPDVLACPLGVAVYHLKKPVSLILERKEDLAYSVKRHPSTTIIRTALDKNGKILAHDIDLKLDAGAYESCSMVVLQRAVFTVTNVYNFPHVRIRGRAYCTNKPPSDAFRGFGAPQAVFAMESHMNYLADFLGEDPLIFRQPYLLKQGGRTVTEGRVHEKVILPEMTRRVLEMSSYREKYWAYQSRSGRGIGFSYFIHGCGFTGSGERDLIKARIKLIKKSDGRIEIYGSNVEMGQGLSTTFCKIAAETAGVDLDRVDYMTPDTGEVPDSGPTVASRSIAIVGNLIQKGTEELKRIWKDGEEQTVYKDYVPPKNQVPWNGETLKGDAYPAYSWGVNVVEVEVDPLTFEIEVKGLWGVYDVGVPIDRKIVEGQIQGGMIQALGYSSLEKLEVKDGRFRQATLADYIIPTSMDFPSVQSDIMDNPYAFGPFGAKGAGEMVFDGGAPAYAAAVSQAVGQVVTEIPVLPETLMEWADEER